MPARLTHSLLLVCLLSTAAIPGPTAADTFSPRLERIAAVATSDRAFPRESLAPDLRASFETGARPLSLATGDFDGDGMPDLAAGFAVAGGGHGLVALWRGNLDFLFPGTPEARRRRAEGRLDAEPFLGPPALFATPVPPERLAAGNFDRDAHVDLIAAGASPAAVWLLPGDGRGALGQAIRAQPPELPAAWRAGATESAEDTTADPVAVLELRLNSDAFPDLVTLEAGAAAPSVVVTAFDRTFTVDSTVDDPDDDLMDGVCATAGGACTLRAAIQQANDLGGSTEIGFAISPGTDILPRVIMVQTQLPDLTEAITIDGTTQTQVVAIDGGGNFAGPGLTLAAAGQAVRDLHIWGFGGSAIEVMAEGITIIESCRIGKTSDFANVAGSGNLQGIKVLTPPDFGQVTIGGSAAAARNVITGNGNFGISVEGVTVQTTIEGNYIGTNTLGTAIPNGTSPQSKGIELIGTNQSQTIQGNLVSGNVTGIHIDNDSVVTVTDNRIGTDLAGTSALPNQTGILVGQAFDLSIGGSTAADRNLISGNTGPGIQLLVPDNNFALIENNYIGTNITGDAALGNGFGIFASGEDGPHVASNVISGNLNHGIFLSSSQDTVIENNIIGMDKTGTTALGNGSHGIWISDNSSNIKIGPDLTAMGNLIAHNGAAGVGVKQSGDVEIQENRIHSNARLGIDLVKDGFLWDDVTLNDDQDADTGPNSLQNFPVITDVSAAGTVFGSLNSTASQQFEIEVFSSPTCDPSGFGEGENYLDDTFETTDGSGIALWSVNGVPAGHYVTAVAYREIGTKETSEFSMCRRHHATCPHPPDLVLTDAQIVGAQSFTACQTITTNGQFSVGLFSSATLTAGVSVELGNGASFFGGLTVEIDPTLDVP